MHISTSIQPDLLYPLLPPLSLLDKEGNFLYHSQKAEKVISYWNPHALPEHIGALKYPELVNELNYFLALPSAQKTDRKFTLVAPGEEDHILRFRLETHPELKDTFILYLPKDSEPYLSKEQSPGRFLKSDLSDVSIPEATFYNNALGLSISGFDGIIYRVNETFSKMVGYTPEELEGRSFYELNHPLDTPPNKELIQKLITGQVSWINFEKRYIKKSLVWI